MLFALLEGATNRNHFVRRLHTHAHPVGGIVGLALIVNGVVVEPANRARLPAIPRGVESIADDDEPHAGLLAVFNEPDRFFDAAIGAVEAVENNRAVAATGEPALEHHVTWARVVMPARAVSLFVAPPFDVVAGALAIAHDRVALALRRDAILFAEHLRLAVVAAG